MFCMGMMESSVETTCEARTFSAISSYNGSTRSATSPHLTDCVAREISKPCRVKISSDLRMWVYVGDDQHPYNVFDFTLSRGRDGPKYFLTGYNQVLLADAYGGHNGGWPATASSASASGHT